MNTGIECRDRQIIITCIIHDDAHQLKTHTLLEKSYGDSEKKHDPVYVNLYGEVIHKRCQQKAYNREKWAHVVKEAKFLREAYSQVTNYVIKYRWAILNRFGEIRKKISFFCEK
jgi:hypothetical protein